MKIKSNIFIAVIGILPFLSFWGKSESFYFTLEKEDGTRQLVVSDSVSGRALHSIPLEGKKCFQMLRPNQDGTALAGFCYADTEYSALDSFVVFDLSRNELIHLQDCSDSTFGPVDYWWEESNVVVLRINNQTALSFALKGGRGADRILPIFGKQISPPIPVGEMYAGILTEETDLVRGYRIVKENNEWKLCLGKAIYRMPLFQLPIAYIKDEDNILWGLNQARQYAVAYDPLTDKVWNIEMNNKVGNAFVGRHNLYYLMTIHGRAFVQRKRKRGEKRFETVFSIAEKPENNVADFSVDRLERRFIIAQALDEPYTSQITIVEGRKRRVIPITGIVRSVGWLAECSRIPE